LLLAQTGKNGSIRQPDRHSLRAPRLLPVTQFQGGTVFAPGTHPFSGSDKRHAGKTERLMSVLQLQRNQRIVAHNLRKLSKMRNSGEPLITNDE
jgi:hypothetical protein